MEAALFVRKEIPNSNPQVSLNSYCTGIVSQNYDFLFHLTLLKKSAIITRVFYCAERKAFCPPTLISLWSFSRKLLSPWTSQALSSPSTQPVLKTEPLSITQQVLIRGKPSMHCLCHFPSSAFKCVLPAFQAYFKSSFSEMPFVMGPLFPTSFTSTQACYFCNTSCSSC